jgi:site-specific recombinase XerC
VMAIFTWMLSSGASHTMTVKRDDAIDKRDQDKENQKRPIKHLKVAFGATRLVEIAADSIDIYLRERLRDRVVVKAKLGYKQLGTVKSTTVHQEFRVLRRMLNVAVRKKLLAANPCSGVEFPVAVKGLFRPHYVSWSEQQKIESHAPQYLRNVVRIITETGLRIYKELIPMRKDQVDLQNAVGLDTGFEDSERHGRSSPHLARHRSFQKSDGDFRCRTVFVSECSESDWASQETQDRLDENSATGKDSLFSDLRPAFCLCHKAKRRRRRRMGHSTAPPERRASLQEVLPNEVADEARSTGEAQPSSQ